MKIVPEVKIILLGCVFIFVLVGLVILGKMSQNESRKHVDKYSKINIKFSGGNNYSLKNSAPLTYQTKVEIFRKALKADKYVNEITSSSSLKSLKYGDTLTVKNKTVALLNPSDINLVSKWKYFTGDTKVKFIRLDTYKGKNYICVGLNSGDGRMMNTVWISDLAVTAEVNKIYMDRFDTEWDEKETLREQEFIKIADSYSISDDQVYEIFAEGLNENW